MKDLITTASLTKMINAARETKPRTHSSTMKNALKLIGIEFLEEARYDAGKRLAKCYIITTEMALKLIKLEEAIVARKVVAMLEEVEVIEEVTPVVETTPLFPVRANDQVSQLSSAIELIVAQRGLHSIGAEIVNSIPTGVMTMTEFVSEYMPDDIDYDCEDMMEYFFCVCVFIDGKPIDQAERFFLPVHYQIHESALYHTLWLVRTETAKELQQFICK